VQSELATQLDGQLTCPPHRYEPHDGTPARPAGTVTQAPLTRLQASQLPAHAVSQQTPSAQWSDLHWLAAVQGNPFSAFSLHSPPTQAWVEAQPTSLVQVEEHDFEVPEHRYGEQEGKPVAPSAFKVQVPTLPATAQLSQDEEQPVLQQKPELQNPEAHCR
jgi:hypothetical protein